MGYLPVARIVCVRPTQCWRYAKQERLCVCACVSVNVCARGCSWVGVCVRVCARVCVYACVYLGVCGCVWVCVCVVVTAEVRCASFHLPVSACGALIVSDICDS